MHVYERGLQQLGETGAPLLPRGRLLALQVQGLLVLQLQLCQLQHQRLLPHCPLGWWPTQRGRPQVWDGEAKSEHGVGGQEGEGRAKFDALGLRRKKRDPSWTHFQNISWTWIYRGDSVMINRVITADHRFITEPGGWKVDIRTIGELLIPSEPRQLFNVCVSTSLISQT